MNLQYGVYVQATGRMGSVRCQIEDRPFVVPVLLTGRAVIGVWSAYSKALEGQPYVRDIEVIFQGRSPKWMPRKSLTSATGEPIPHEEDKALAAWLIEQNQSGER